jgi:hypothetical protein
VQVTSEFSIGLVLPGRNHITRVNHLLSSLTLNRELVLYRLHATDLL